MERSWFIRSFVVFLLSSLVVGATTKKGDWMHTMPREERRRLAGVNVRLSWPSADPTVPPKGVAFLLPGAMVSISEYNGLRDVILRQNHLVVSIYINVLWPVRGNHRKHAENIKHIFDELRSAYESILKSVEAYKIIGHSAGGKIALLMKSIVDTERVLAVLALDPVDLNPIEFTNKKGSNLPLNNMYGKETAGALKCSSDEEDGGFICVNKQKVTAKDKTPIILTCTDGGLGIPKTHNAEAIHKFHPATILYRHIKAGHMAYCDHGGGWAGSIMPDRGSPDGNEKARNDAHELIRQILQ